MKRSYHIALLMALLALCTIIYLPGLQGGFVYDDYPNIIDAPAFSDPASASLRRVLAEGMSSATGRPISMASFYLSYRGAAGFDAPSFKAAGLAIHLLNGLLLYLLATRLLRTTAHDENRARTYALLVTAFWLLHPLHVSTVMYVVQRMTLLATLFMLLGLLTYVIGRDRIAGHKPYGYLALAVSLLCMPLAFLSKEIGALQGLLALTLEWFILAPARPLKERKALHAYFGLTVYLPALALMIGFLTGTANGLISYAGRPFTLAERLMTESRVVLEYMRWILVPDIQQYGLFHDDIRLSTGPWSPPTTLLAIVVLSIIALAMWSTRKRWPLIAGGIAFFFVGLSLESTVLPLLIAFEHRNYLPSAGLLLGLVAAIAYLPRDTRLHRLLPGTALVVIALLAFATLTRAMIWGNPLAHAQSEVANHPDSPLAHHQVAVALTRIAASPSLDAEQMQKYAGEAMQHVNMASALSPESPIYRVGALWISSEFLTTPNREEINSVASFLEQSESNIALGSSLGGLIDCVHLKRCKIDESDQRQLITSALKNRRIGGHNRASILTALAAIENQSGNPDKAIEALTLAIESASIKSPYQLTLIRYLADLGYYERAAKLIKDVRSSSNGEAFKTDLDNLERRLTSGG